MKNWPELKSVHNIQVFLSFANFYHYFIQGFNMIATPLTLLLRMSPTLKSAMQKLVNLVDQFDEGDCGKNEAKTSASTKEPTGVHYPSFNHVSYVVSNFVSNFAKNVSNYLTLDAKRAFDQLRQAFT